MKKESIPGRSVVDDRERAYRVPGVRWPAVVTERLRGLATTVLHAFGVACRMAGMLASS
jgi:hypothetical protein